ncbi:MAG: hypothetical protein LBR00_07955 [Clostridiales Family XIII bacterium]|jgi:hypothetical protein|nr:hypothetical protein [Clostridiales Family XIII bacterium]
MNYETYRNRVAATFPDREPFEWEGITVFQEDVFRLYWLSRVRFFTFLADSEKIDLEELDNYARACVGYATKHRNKPAGIVVVNAALAAPKATKDALAFADARPRRRNTSDEFPVAVDLKKGEAHYYTGPIVYGLLYERFERAYIHRHLVAPLREEIEAPRP